MEMEVQEGKFLESANFHGNVYVTSIVAMETVADAGKVLDLTLFLLISRYYFSAMDP